MNPIFWILAIVVPYLVYDWTRYRRYKETMRIANNALSDSRTVMHAVNARMELVRTENTKLKESLHFYADLESWYQRPKDHCSDRRAYVYSHAFKDFGQKARDTLGMKEVKPFTDHF